VTRVLVARQDSVGDVLLMGPAVRAVAAGAEHVAFLAGSTGAAAAHLLPGVDEVLVHDAPWIAPEPDPVDRTTTADLVDDVAARRFDVAIVFTSFHQSPLPLALLLRLAGVLTIAAISVDYPGSLLDVRHQVPDDEHEVARALSLALAAGFDLPPQDSGRLRLRAGVGVAERSPVGPPYVVVHPGASAPARAWSADGNGALVRALARRGHRVVVTGGPSERDLTRDVAGRHRSAVDLGGRTDLPGLADVLAGADAVVVGNTGAAHLAAAVGTPVVSLFAPTVPATRWRPWAVAHELLGDQSITCAGCRARRCPVLGHPCLAAVDVAAVTAALDRLDRARVAS
jgi:ADP-heptose:LPS heptosyltransferase